MIKVDLHTHSIASPDGGIKPEQYAQIIEDGILDYVAVTDHNHINLALKLHDTLGERLIVGEEITSSQGEIIGLFLKKMVAPGQTALETVKAIHKQGGLVYLPHPFESVRLGLSEANLIPIADEVDIVEVHNGRAVFQNRGPQATTWARLHSKVMAASSDAHGCKGLGTTYILLDTPPSVDNLLTILSYARYVTNRPPLRTLLYPKVHRLTKKLKLL